MNLDKTGKEKANPGILDEYRHHDADVINKIILPLLNIDKPEAKEDFDASKGNN